jgi:hypothetical protein
MNPVGFIYKAVNRETQEVYIGATTKSIEERIVDHSDKASRNEGSKFQRAIATYGPDAFDWVVIDTANDINGLAKKEKECIIKYNSKEKGLNSDSGGGFKKMVYQYDLESNLICTYDSLMSAASVIGVTKKRISDACLRKSHLLENYYWSYENDFSLNDVRDDRRKSVSQHSLNGEFITKYISVAQASKVSGLSKTCIARVCRGEREFSGGYIWKYN